MDGEGYFILVYFLYLFIYLFFFYQGPCRRKESIPSVPKPKVQHISEEYKIVLLKKWFSFVWLNLGPQRSMFTVKAQRKSVGWTVKYLSSKGQHQSKSFFIMSCQHRDDLRLRPELKQKGREGGWLCRHSQNTFCLVNTASLIRLVVLVCLVVLEGNIFLIKIWSSFFSGQGTATLNAEG